MFDALTEGVQDPVELARLGDRRLRANKEELADALSSRLTEAQRSCAEALFTADRPY